MHKKEKKLTFYPIGKAIKKAREDRRWTQEHIANLVDCTARNIMYIENNGQHPSLDTFYQLVTLLDLSVDQYFYTHNSTNSRKNGLEIILNALTEKELSIIEATAQALKKAREVEE